MSDKELIHSIYMKGYGNTDNNTTKRGVKKGSKRGKYKTKKKAITNPNQITFICKECGRKITYFRKGKRIREFCNNACKQKHYRNQKILKEIEIQKSLF